MVPVQPQTPYQELQEAKRNYVLAVRWLKETIGYKALVSGSEWQNDDDEIDLHKDSELAFQEAKRDLALWRRRLNQAKQKIERERKKNAGKEHLH